MKVTMVGGPFDGQTWEIVGGRSLVLPMMEHLMGPVTKVEMPIRKTQDGFRVYWTERIEG